MSAKEDPDGRKVQKGRGKFQRKPKMSAATVVLVSLFKCFFLGLQFSSSSITSWVKASCGQSGDRRFLSATGLSPPSLLSSSRTGIKKKPGLTIHLQPKPWPKTM